MRREFQQKSTDIGKTLPSFYKRNNLVGSADNSIGCKDNKEKKEHKKPPCNRNGLDTVSSQPFKKHKPVKGRKYRWKRTKQEKPDLKIDHNSQKDKDSKS